METAMHFNSDEKIRERDRMLRSALQEMAEELDLLLARLTSAQDCLIRNEAEFENETRRCDRLESDYEVACASGDEVRARRVLHRMAPVSARLDELAEAINDCERDVQTLCDEYQRKLLGYENLELRCLDIFGHGGGREAG